MLSDRTLIKLQMIHDRGGMSFSDIPVCDHCQTNKAVQMHELIKRSQTSFNKEARELSFQPELCSLLCISCHEKADTKQVDKALWEFNIRLYGIMRVLDAFNKLQAVMRNKIQIEVLNGYREE